MSTSNTERQQPWVAFIEYRATLLDAITEPEILPLANALYSKGVISRYALEEAEMTTRTPTERKTRLLDAVEDKIKTESGMFDTLIDVLRSDSLCLSEHAMKLLQLDFSLYRAEMSTCTPIKGKTDYVSELAGKLSHSFVSNKYRLNVL